MRRFGLAYLLLFIASYAAFVTWSMHGQAIAKQTGPAVAQRASRIRQADAMNLGATSLAALNLTPHRSSASAPNDSSYGVASPPSDVDTQSVYPPASNAIDEDQRAATIRELAVNNGDQATAALQQVLQNDEVARNRLLAVSSLRQIALQGDREGRARALLRVAMADGDTNVATHARDAYEEASRLSTN